MLRVNINAVNSPFLPGVSVAVRGEQEYPRKSLDFRTDVWDEALFKFLPAESGEQMLDYVLDTLLSQYLTIKDRME